MKNNHIFSLFAFAGALLGLTGCSGKDIAVDSFEAGIFEGWTVTGEAFGGYPTLGALPGQEGLTGIDGRYLANSLAGGQDAHGRANSGEFSIQRRYINFLIGGGNRPGVKAELLVGGNPVAVARPAKDGNALEWHSWDVGIWKGRRASIRITDEQDGEWGYILVDRIEMGDRDKSDVVTDFRQSFTVRHDYLLIPLQDDAPESEIKVELNGRRAPMSPLYMQVAQQRVDYWLCMDVSQYKGRELAFVYNHIRKSDIGHGQIKQSDSCEADYNGKHTPAFHYSPHFGWMGEPTGAVFFGDEYHLFYEYNPYGTRRANLGWGHAVTKDLLSWEQLPPVAWPDSIPIPTAANIVADQNNTAGFGKNALVMVYTAGEEERTQNLAYSTDGGHTFAVYSKNPVLSGKGAEELRDPYVFWYPPGKRWEMIVADGNSVVFYASPDMKKWTRQGTFSVDGNADSTAWERPRLFTMKGPDGKDKWVLTVNVASGGPDGGSGMQYFTGSFNGWTFKADERPYPLWLGGGVDSRTIMMWNDIPASDGRDIITGWMSDGGYADLVPSAGSRGAAILPRELSLADGGVASGPDGYPALVSVPAREIETLRRSVHYMGDIEVKASGEHTVSPLLIGTHDDIFELEMTLHAEDATDFGFSLSNGAGEHVDFDFDLKAGSFTLNRSQSGEVNFSPSFAIPVIVPVKQKESYTLRLLADRSSVECFIDGGAVSLTGLVFPSLPYDTLSFHSYNGAMRITDGKIYKLRLPSAQ